MLSVQLANVLANTEAAVIRVSGWQREREVLRETLG
jgi:hypothetical protein